MGMGAEGVSDCSSCSNEGRNEGGGGRGTKTRRRSTTEAVADGGTVGDSDTTGDGSASGNAGILLVLPGALALSSSATEMAALVGGGTRRRGTRSASKIRMNNTAWMSTEPALASDKAR